MTRHRRSDTRPKLRVRPTFLPVLAVAMAAGTVLSLGGRPSIPATLSARDSGVAYSAEADPPPASGPVDAAGATGGVGAVGSQGFTISGGVQDLYPGASKPFTLTIINPFPFRIIVTNITTSVGNASPTCAAANLSVSSFSGQLAVNSRAHSQIAVTATMAHSAPDACQGATFPLQHSGTARR